MTGPVMTLFSIMSDEWKYESRRDWSCLCCVMLFCGVLTGTPFNTVMCPRIVLDCLNHVVQGLFERHKLIVATQLCMAILKKNGELQQQKFDFLLRGPKVMGMENPLKEWVLDSVWGSVQALKVSIGHAASTCTCSPATFVTTVCIVKNVP